MVLVRNGRTLEGKVRWRIDSRYAIVLDQKFERILGRVPCNYCADFCSVTVCGGSAVVYVV